MSWRRTFSAGRVALFPAQALAVDFFRIGQRLARNLEHLARLYQVRIVNEIGIGEVDRRVAHALAVDAARDLPQRIAAPDDDAVAAFGQGRLLDRLRRGGRRLRRDRFNGRGALRGRGFRGGQGQIRRRCQGRKDRLDQRGDLRQFGSDRLDVVRQALQGGVGLCGLRRRCHDEIDDRLGGRCRGAEIGDRLQADLARRARGGELLEHRLLAVRIETLQQGEGLAERAAHLLEGGEIDRHHGAALSGRRLAVLRDDGNLFAFRAIERHRGPHDHLAGGIEQFGVDHMRADRKRDAAFDDEIAAGVGHGIADDRVVREAPDIAADRRLAGDEEAIALDLHGGDLDLRIDGRRALTGRRLVGRRRRCGLATVGHGRG